jgi:hypothetical protein
MNRPVIIRGGIKSQKYFKDWKSDDYLVQNFGRTSVMVEKAKVEDRSANTAMEDMPLSEYIKGYNKNGNEWYIVQDVYPHMLADVAMPKQLECSEMNAGFNMVVMWFSSGGTSSVLHNDEQERITIRIPNPNPSPNPKPVNRRTSSASSKARKSFSSGTRTNTRTSTQLWGSTRTGQALLRSARRRSIWSYSPVSRTLSTRRPPSRPVICSTSRGSGSIR